MARSVDELNKYIIDNLVINFASIGITIDPTLWSRKNFLRMICYTFAIGQALMEQLQDVFMAAIEAISKKSAAASALWVQQKMFDFQYSEDNPQFLIMIGGVPQYPVIDTTLNVIDACSVTSDAPSAVTVKIAAGSPLGAVSDNVKSSAQAYISAIGTAGIIYTIVTADADQLYVEADIFFQGQYTSVIKQSVIDAITNWLSVQSINNFDGKIKMSDLENIIRKVPGVNDIVLKNVRGRGATVLFNAGVDLILATAIIQRQYSSVAGYMIPETTATKTLSDTLNLIAE